MKAERQRIWQAIQRLAATDAAWQFLARDVRHPEQILGGSLSATLLDEQREEDM
jgi:uncharacterized membrane protein YebE (DUF533 family)